MQESVYGWLHFEIVSGMQQLCAGMRDGPVVSSAGPGGPLCRLHLPAAFCFSLLIPMSCTALPSTQV